MDNRWGSLSGQEYLYRLWQGLIVGTYVTHGECYMDDPKDYSRDFWLWEELFKGNPGSALALQDRFWMHSLILYIYVIAVGTLILRLPEKIII